jgi:hypothetical protein
VSLRAGGSNLTKVGALRHLTCFFADEARRRLSRPLQEDHIMISLILGIVLAIIAIEVAVGMWIGWWLFAPEQNRDEDCQWYASSGGANRHGRMLQRSGAAVAVRRAGYHRHEKGSTSAGGFQP